MGSNTTVVKATNLLHQNKSLSKNIMVTFNKLTRNSEKKHRICS